MLILGFLPFVGVACGSSVVITTGSTGSGGAGTSTSTNGTAANGNGGLGTGTASTGTASTGAGSTLPCTSDAQCWGGAPHCDTATGVCTGCTGAADCAQFMQVCDTGTGACVECASNADCAMMGGQTCDLATHACRDACTTDAQCNHGVCHAGVCVDCKVDGDCDQGQRCEPGTHVCVDCLTAMDCPADMPLCASNVCGVVCKDDAACAASMGFCDVAHGVCVECVTNAQCGMGGVCQSDQTCGGMGG